MSKRMDELIIKVEIKDVFEVKGKRKSARMLLFEGDCNCDNFHGRILPGAVDTQKESEVSLPILSARYILEGIDRAGQACKIFIENNGTVEKDKELVTNPVIITDSEALRYLEDRKLSGSIEPWEKGVIIRIF